MGRKKRIYCDSEIYHVILRGNNRNNIFFSKKDRYYFLKKMQQYATQLEIKILSYCLMDNHVHILLGNANKFLSKFIQKLATSYAMYFNHKYDHSGHLFQGRFISEPVTNEKYLKNVTKYILKNPEIAKVEKYNNYFWSSYKESISNNEVKKITQKDFIKNTFGSIEIFSFYMENEKITPCMEYENKKFINDKTACELIIKKLGIKNIYKIHKYPKSMKNNLIHQIKKLGLSINQISRITGISKAVIKQA